jgi:hypothetical protein
MKNKRGGDGPRKVATGLYIALLLNIILFIFFVLNTTVHLFKKKGKKQQLDWAAAV